MSRVNGFPRRGPNAGVPTPGLVLRADSAHGPLTATVLIFILVSLTLGGYMLDPPSVGSARSAALLAAVHENINVAVSPPPSSAQILRAALVRSAGGVETYAYDAVHDSAPDKDLAAIGALSAPKSTLGSYAVEVTPGGHAYAVLAHSAHQARQTPVAGYDAGAPTSRPNVGESAKPVPISTSGVATKTADVGLSTRGLVPGAGTRLVPEGIPGGWRISGTKTPGGVRYYDPANPGNSVRVMQGSPNSQYANSQSPYVRWQKNGQPLDVNGNKLDTANTPEAHIPLDQFQFLPELFR